MLINQRGQSIVEVLIAVVVVAMVMTAIASALTFSVKSTSAARYRAFAASYAQEALEVYRKERAVQGWESFVTDAAPGSYCLNTLPTSSDEFRALPAAPCEEGVAKVGSDFTREVVVTNPAADTLIVTTTVEWTDGNVTSHVDSSQTFRQWSQQ